ncbi:MAG TPA: UDP-N-acetylmuramate--L-alanine ligase [Mycobacteriales bacterium]|nr:UDP-N-acetylmuramate--L-alanine ligase [Mycobacteriales bacterium]
MTAADAAPVVPAAEELGRVHLIGIGGAGMSGIARILLGRGLPVSGSDAKDSRALTALRALGATVHVGHDVAHLGDADTVVVSSAIRAGNPELVGAHERGLRVLPRAAALAAVMAGRQAVAVAGTHGKTTTTSMLTVVLQQAGADPSYAIGGDLNEPGSNAHHGTGEIFVAEADESDGSFLMLAPHLAVVTNVEADHLDHYGDPDAYARAFSDFVGRVAADGVLVACADDPGAARLVDVARERGLRPVTYGIDADADVRLVDVQAVDGGSTFELVASGRRLGAVTLVVPGRHYALDAGAAITAALELGVPFEPIRQGLGGFRGARRRFEPKGERDGVRVYDSYAHHPTEIAADLRAAREVAGAGRVVVAFQPHLYSRTQAFAAELGEALGLADEVVVMDVYAAREDPVPGVTGAIVAAAVPLPAERVCYEPSWSAVAERLADRAAPGDLLLTLGAGDVTMIGPEVLDVLARRAADGGRP